MKKQLRLLMLTLLCAVFSTAWGTTKDILTAADLAATGSTYTEFSGVTKGSGAVYAGKSAKNGDNIQLRSSGSDCGIVTTTSGGKVKSVKIVVASGTKTIDVYGNNTAYTSAANLYATGASNQGTKIGSLTATGTINVTDDYSYIGIRSNNGAVYISSIEIEWESAPSIPYVATINSISPISVEINETGQFELDATFNSNANASDYDLTWTSSNANLLTVDNQGNYEAKSSEGTVTITVTAQSKNENYQTASKEFTVTIVDPNKPGTADNPYTVDQALELINTQGGSGDNMVYVSGIISQIDDINTTQYYNATYFISDDGNTTSQLEVYRGKYLNNVGFTSQDQIAVGDAVIVYGQLIKYNDTPEFAQGNYIVEHSGKTPIATDITVEPTTISINEEGTFIVAVTPADNITSNDYTITWSCDADNELIIDESTGEYLAGTTAGEFNVTVTVTPVEGKVGTYKSFSKSFVITIVDPNAGDGTFEKPYSVAEVIGLYNKNNNINLAGKYVKGFIVGNYKNNTFYSVPEEEDANIALADDADETNGANTIPVQLPEGLYRKALNLQDNGNMGLEVVIKGTINKYFNKAGLRTASDVYFFTTIGSTGYSTLYFGQNNLKITDGGAKAYTVTATATATGADLEYTEIAEIPSGTGVVLKGSGKQTIHVIASTEVEVTDNDLYGTDKAAQTTAPTNAAYYFYKLSTNTAGDEGSVGFWWGAAGGAAFEIPAHKAYLAILQSEFENLVTESFVFDETVGINKVQKDALSAEGIYTLSGIRVNGDNLPKGIYIVNGKKIVIK